jgi:hypothetical protein
VKIREQIAKLFIDPPEKNWRRAYSILVLVFASFFQIPILFLVSCFKKGAVSEILY